MNDTAFRSDKCVAHSVQIDNIEKEITELRQKTFNEIFAKLDKLLENTAGMKVQIDNHTLVLKIVIGILVTGGGIGAILKLIP